MLKESLVSSALCSGVFAELCSMGAITLSLICPVSFVFAVTGFTGWDAPVMLSFCTGCSVTSVLVTLFPLSVILIVVCTPGPDVAPFGPATFICISGFGWLTVTLTLPQFGL